MGSSGKKKTTMAKLTRERKLRERRLDKAARKVARKEAAANLLLNPEGAFNPDDPEAEHSDLEQTDLEAVGQTPRSVDRSSHTGEDRPGIDQVRTP
jgi:hypothetical protein